MNLKTEVVCQGSEVLLDYSLSTDDEILDTTDGVGPLRVKIGEKQIHPAIEKNLLGRQAGESFEVLLDPSLAFGEVDPSLKITMSKRKLPEAFQNLHEGDSFESKDPKGRARNFRILKIQGEQVTLDGNHPYAGAIVQLEGKILEIF